MTNDSFSTPAIQRESYRIQFTGSLGYELAGIIDRPSDEKEIRATAVFSHCFTCNKDLKAIVRISRALSSVGVAVLRFDMTGLGGSDGDFSETNFSTNVEDLHLAIEFARRELGSLNGLIGHSFGGAATLAVTGAMSAANTQPTNSIPVAITLAAPSDTQHLAVLLSKMNPEIECNGSGMVTIGGRSWRITQKMLDDFRSHNLPKLIGQIQSPTLLFHSPVDETVSYDHAIRIAGLIQNGSNEATPPSIISLIDSDHLLTRPGTTIDWVSSTIAAFLMRFSNRI
ncbi:lysophospholipase [Rubripirellula sp.]|jgi:alpha/beta superfamily hydrolase|nr:lysophospholipase [Rubripirellula sp.]